MSQPCYTLLTEIDEGMVWSLYDLIEELNPGKTALVHMTQESDFDYISGRWRFTVVITVSDEILATKLMMFVPGAKRG